MSTLVLTDLIEGAAAKYLSNVDADRTSSNQHEIGGLVQAGFKQHLEDSAEHIATMCYVSDEESPISILDTITWYDSRENDPNRSPEYRLYYKDNAVTELMNPGDFFLIAKLADGNLIIAITPADGICEQQLRYLFDIPLNIDKLSNVRPRSLDISVPLQLALEEIGLELPIEHDDRALSMMIDEFGQSFPSTQKMSEFARSRVEIDPVAFPDEALLAWMNEEEKLFRLFERHLYASEIGTELANRTLDIDKFVSISLGIHNRRKSRAGLAFEHHLGEILFRSRITFQRGTSRLVTENKSKPDFLFPSFEKYHDDSYPSSRLRMLGAKTSLKDRWRQVLAEAARIENKHLATLQAGISNAQLDEMHSNNLQLVIPRELILDYPEDQSNRLLSVREFIEELKTLQND